MLRYAKALTALIGAVATALPPVLADGSISGADWIAIALAVATAAGVGAVPNKRDRADHPVHGAP